MENQKLTAKEKAMFSALSNARMPSKALEENIIDSLKNEGLIGREKHPIKNRILWLGTIAASILFFLVGNQVGKHSTAEVNINPRLGYMLILHEDENFNPGNPEEMSQEYASWSQNLKNQGVKITGQELRNEATFIKADSETTIEGKSKGRITGYFIFEASNQNEALEIAQKSPHLKYGGHIELKSFMVRN